MKKVYHYIVSYVATQKQTQYRCTACSQIKRKKKIETFEDFTYVRLFIEKENDLQDVVITNIIKLKTTLERGKW